MCESVGTTVSGSLFRTQRENLMELTPLTNTSIASQKIDRRLQDIDRQINTALRDIRRNLEELEQASASPDRTDASGTAAGGKDFAKALQDAIDRGPPPTR